MSMRCKFYDNIKNIVGEYKLRDRREFDQCRGKRQGQQGQQKYDTKQFQRYDQYGKLIG